MNMKLTQELVQKILYHLENCIFDEFAPGEINECEKVWDRVDHDFFSCFNSGASKMVLHLKDYNYVVKIPFQGEFIRQWDEEDPNSFSKIFEFCPFQYARGEKNDWDYCEVEANYFSDAVNYKVDQFFLETRFIGFVHDYPIYIQEKAIPLDEAVDSPRGYHPKEIRSKCSYYGICCFNSHWIEDFLDYYTIEELQLLTDFIENVGITDLHSGNLGYKDSVPVIFDYAGFED